jgi:hypothetical protein
MTDANNRIASGERHAIEQTDSEPVAYCRRRGSACRWKVSDQALSKTPDRCPLVN